MTTDLSKLPPAQSPAEESIRRTLQDLVDVDAALIENEAKIRGIGTLPRRPKELREQRKKELYDERNELIAKRDKHLKRIQHLQTGLPPRK